MEDKLSSKFASTSLAYKQNQFGFYTSQVQQLENKIPIAWNSNAELNYNGVKPPDKSMVVNKPTSSKGYPLFQIQQRDPYKVQYMVNEYGSLNSRVGTELGR